MSTPSACSLQAPNISLAKPGLPPGMAEMNVPPTELLPGRLMYRQSFC